MKAIRSLRPMSACALVAMSVATTAEVRAQAGAEAGTKPAAPADAAPQPAAPAAPVDASPAAPAAPAASPAAETAGDVSLESVIKKHAEQCSDAQLKMDFDKLFPYVPPKLVELMGGRAALKAKLAQGNGELKRRGVTIDSATVGNPEAPQEHGGVMVSLVPLTTAMTTPQGKVIASSHLIAISEDKGASWVFADTATVNNDKLALLYPPLRGKVTLPPATAERVQ